ncbi:MAG: CoA transferase [Deltaproteobacteria bacterium]|nr:CoA transferase [Deltaproteobacteria bacterium]
MGPLEGIKILEIAGIGPGPFAAMLLADMGAEVVRIDRPGGQAISFPDPNYDLLNRGRPSVAIDLKKPGGTELLLRMVEQADALMEGFRPGVMERLGVGPEVCLERNPRLVYGRMTGWGQEGPLAPRAGHDINYISLGGALEHIGRAGQAPTPPLNLVGDFGGGGLYLVVGMLCALLERVRSGQGQVVDAAMVDGTASLMTVFHAIDQLGAMNERGRNIIDSGSHFYDAYECADGRYVSIGSVEPQFHAELLARLGIDDIEPAQQMDGEAWPKLKERFTALFKTKTRDEWCEVFEGSDACFAPVLSLAESRKHPHAVARNSFISIEGVEQPAPAPRFSRTRPEVTQRAARVGEHSAEVLGNWGFSGDEIEAAREGGIIND